MKKIGNAAYSVAFKVFLFVVLGISFALGILSVLAGIYLVELGAYNRSEQEYLYEALKPVAYQHLAPICYDETQYPKYYDIREAVAADSLENGIGYSIRKNTNELYNNFPNDSTPFVYTREASREISGAVSDTEEYEITLYVYQSFPKADEFRLVHNFSKWLYFWRFNIIFIASGCILLFIISFVWLLCNAGRRRGEEGVVPSVLTRIPLEILAAVFGFVAAVPLMIAYEEVYYIEWVDLPVLVVLGIFEVVWCTAFCRELALRIKLRRGNSLLCAAFRLVWRMLRAVCRGLAALIRDVPMILHVVATVIFLTSCELIGILCWGEAELAVCWILEKLIVLPVILYCAIAFKRLQMGSQALAEGDLSRKLDTKYLFLDFKQHGDNLNKLGDGISKAVEQRMRSERLKTELITNVSHDIKTPLTSVINYADLLGTEVGKENTTLDAAKVAEYSEVLVRQSKRLKKLLDDLLEASKATTGSLEVNLAPCEIGVLLTQAAGEYEARFVEKNLTLHTRQPEEGIRIMADGRHLWRVFDNLLNNICKYAQDGSRVYINVEKDGGRVEIIFRNMSRYELNVSAQELEERFVRGDKSRNMEGNGLGLSIAKSLVELQNGTMQIVTDGDLFKVILSFQLLEKEEQV